MRDCVCVLVKERQQLAGFGHHGVHVWEERLDVAGVHVAAAADVVAAGLFQPQRHPSELGGQEHNASVATVHVLGFHRCRQGAFTAC
jgi:hypothetical protein